jgi:hypothetical protein
VLGDLGDDGVAEGSQSVHDQNRAAIWSDIVDPTAASAVGVGNDEQASPCVWGTHGARWNSRPLRIEPEGVQISENGAESPNNEVTDVLHEHESGS